MSNAASNWQPDLEQLRSIHAAAAETVKQTPVFSLGELSRRCGGTVVVKAENMQRTGSFKLRGSLAKLAGRDPADCRGVVAGSAGNHGQALAYAARAREHPLHGLHARGRGDLEGRRGHRLRRRGRARGERDRRVPAGRPPARRGGGAALRPPLRRPRRDPGPGRGRARAARPGPRPGEGDRPGRRRRVDQRDRGRARRRAAAASRSPASRPRAAPPSPPRSRAASRRRSPCPRRSPTGSRSSDRAS